MANLLVECNYCRMSSPDSRRCARCFTVYYCSKHCQRLDWPSHRQNCNSSNQTESSECKKGKTEKGVCSTCNKDDCTTKCSRCKTTFYCSRECQALNWSQHRKVCPKQIPHDVKDGSEFTEDENRILAYRIEKHNQRKREGEKWKETVKKFKGKHAHVYVMHTASYTGGSDRFYQLLTPEQLAVFERRPPGSLPKAVWYIKARLPDWGIIKCFVEVPKEFDQAGLATYRYEKSNILVAFMFMYHHHAMRHGVYLKDAKDEIMHVEFYFDHLDDDPRPYFTYDQVKPGDYIFIKNPGLHTYGDGVIGFRINHPSEVLLADINLLK